MGGRQDKRDDDELTKLKEGWRRIEMIAGRKRLYEIYDDWGKLVRKIMTMNVDDGGVNTAAEEMKRVMKNKTYKCLREFYEGKGRRMKRVVTMIADVGFSHEETTDSSRFSRIGSSYLWLLLELVLLSVVLCMYMGSFG